jgi:glutaredoxin 3
MTSREVVIYTTMFCPFCQSAKALLTKKGVPFKEIPVEGDRAGRAAMTARANGRTTVPQIFFGDRHIGGCDDLHALDASGQLDALISETVG